MDRMSMEQLDRCVDAQFDRMVQVRRHLHAHPEISGEERQTAGYLCALFEEAGLGTTPMADGRGLIVDAPESGSGSRIALRADIDALPIQDAKGTSYKSRIPGVMHACGHDAHAATVLGAVRGIASAQASGALPWPVRWRAVFQPAEETNQGAKWMIRDGALEGVGAIITLHMDPSRVVGNVGVGAGYITADCVTIQIDIQGRGGHASRPHESIDPIAIAAQLISSIYLFVPRAISTHDPVVVTFGKIAGGISYNVIPDQVHLGGTLRTLGGDTKTAAMCHIEQLARGLAETSGARIDVSYCDGPPPVYNDQGLTDLLWDSASELLGDQHLQRITQPSMGGEDFANYLAYVPGSMFRLGCRAPEGPALPLHSPEFDIDEQALRVGARVLARAAVRWCDPRNESIK